MIPVSAPSLGVLERKLVNDCLDKNQLTYGPMTQRFERELAERLGVRTAMATSSGTTALHLALVSLGIGPGDEVLVPDLTFVATANAVFYTGARVVLVDVDPKTWCMDVADAASKVTRKTKAIVPVHLYGIACDMRALRELADIYSLLIVEDAAEALGGTCAEQALGTFGKAGVFSFYGNKILTTGEGGAVVTNDETLERRLYLLRGQAIDPKRRYYHPEIGFNYRMTDLQAAVGVGQLARLDQMLQRRESLFQVYEDRLNGYGIGPVVPNGSRRAPWLFTVRVHPSVDRDALMSYLAAEGIETRPTFVPLHRMPMYCRPDGEFPYANAIGNCGLSLPTYPDLTFQQADHVCDVILKKLVRMEDAHVDPSGATRAAR